VSAYDALIIGAGHNGLVCASYLAAQGLRVRVLEANAEVGGLAATRVFFPGFRASVAHTVSHFSHRVLKDLAIDTDLLRHPLPSIALSPEGRHIKIDDGEVYGASDEDKQAYSEYAKRLQRFSRVLAPLWTQAAPPIGGNTLGEVLKFAHTGLRMRSLGRRNMGELLRVITLPLQDLMDEHFHNPALQSLLAWEGLIGNQQAPRSPNNSVLQLLYRMSEGTMPIHVLPNGGIQGFIQSLRQAAEDRGVEITTHTRVSRVLLNSTQSGLAVTGVKTAAGETIEADRVVSNADPQTTFLDLLGSENLEIEFSNRIRRIRANGYVAKLHLALKGEPIFSNLERADGRMILASSLKVIEQAYDDAKYGGLPEQPVMEIVVPSLRDSSLAPAGQHVLSAHVMYVPSKLQEGWSDSSRRRLYDLILGTIEAYAPNIRSLVLGHELLTPLDLEHTFSNRGGHWQHGDLALDQMLMMRPTYGAAQYASPVEGLYLCGAGCHPAGDLTGAPGFNAARAISA